ncbi:MAG: S-layer homology domain-containing protein, partial [Nanoarchaeota archaeon]|nr:S-layer homology domain-containing protein [Nanoarchaeota archaeon]
MGAVEYGSAYNPPPPTGIFADVPRDHWAAAWIERLYSAGITAGCATNPLRYCPEDSVTRAQMAIFLER